jgi:hypothetical protein
MTAQRLIEDARAAGFSIEVDGGDLIVEADGDPPLDLIAALRENKAELIAFLKPPPAEAVAVARDAVAPAEYATASFAADAAAERAAIIEFGAGVPRRWAEGLAALAAMPVPSGFAPERWRRIVDAAGTFLDRWTGVAIECGWSDLDVFGCDPVRPDARFDAMGVALLLDRAEVVGIDDEGADLVTVTGARQRYRRRPLPPDTVTLWDLMIAERGSDAG